MEVIVFVMKKLLAFCAILATHSQASSIKVQNDFRFSWGAARIHEVSVSDLHVCARDDEGVQCWYTEDYRNGLPTNLPFNYKIPYFEDSNSIIQLSSGHAHTCALYTTGEVKCLGWNDRGNLGNGFYYFDEDHWERNRDYARVREMRAEKEKQLALNRAPDDAVQISSKYYHTCAITKKNKIVCWGSNKEGQASPPNLNPKNPKMISTGQGHTCLLDANGVKCWGNNNYGQTVVPSLKNPKQIVSGANHNCAIDDDGVKCWGKGTIRRENVYSTPLSDSEISSLKITNPHHIISSSEGVIIFDETKVYAINSNLKLDSKFPQPTTVSISSEEDYCYTDYKGINCRSIRTPNRFNPETPIMPKIENEACKNLNRESKQYLYCNVILNSLSMVKTHLYKPKSILIDHVIKSMEKNPNEILFLFEIIKPFLKSHTSRLFKNFYIPNLDIFSDKLSKENPELLKNSMLRTTEKDSLALLLTAQLLKSIKNSTELPEDHILIDKFMIETGLSIHSPELQNSIVLKLKSRADIFEKLSQNSNTRPMALSLLAILNNYFNEEVRNSL